VECSETQSRRMNRQHSQMATPLGVGEHPIGKQATPNTPYASAFFRDLPPTTPPPDDLAVFRGAWPSPPGWSADTVRYPPI
jgi:hypothetical protein